MKNPFSHPDQPVATGTSGSAASTEGYDQQVHWRPFFDRALAQEVVSTDARRRDERLPGYVRFMLPIPAEPDEAHDVIQMLELLECTHGSKQVLTPLPMLQLALVSAIHGLGRGLTELASQRLYYSAALFVGALVEHDIEQALVRAGKGISQRRAPTSPVLPKAGSPNMDFEDFHLAARLLIPGQHISMTTMSRRAQGVAAASWALRQESGPDAERDLLRLGRIAGPEWKYLASAILQLLRDRAIDLPPPLRACFVPKKKQQASD